MGKGLEKILEKNKAAITKKWFHLAAQTYAIDTAKFLKSQTDPFANPVGNTMLNALDGILEQLIHTMDSQTLNSHLDSIIRIRAIQNFTPSQATAFILSLKRILREYLAKELQDSRLTTEFIDVESKIDLICLMAFDIYMQCREKVYQISANETRNRTFSAFERAGLIAESPD
jgi:RsbT co-antagonist protein rsbRD N-terminal domain